MRRFGRKHYMNRIDSRDLISIIVPVYNVEIYLTECVRSILNQTYKNIEILLIDDGSSDNSGVLCENLAKQDDRIKVFHKENGGLSDARNYGIEKAVGEFIMFVDSDDLVSESIVDNLYNMIVSDKELKLAVCGLSHFTDGENVQYDLGKEITIFSREAALVDFLCQNNIPTSSCAKLYNKELLNGIRFVKGQRFEDNEFVFKVISHCDYIGYCNTKLYAYRHRINSITTSKFDEKEFDIIEIGKKIIDYSKNFSIDVQDAAIVYQCTNCLRICLTGTEQFVNDERYIYCYNYVKQNSKRIINNCSARKKIKIVLFLISLNVPMKFLRKIRNRISRWS